MGEIVKDGNIDREVIKVACPVVDGNDQGFYVTYRDAMKDGEVEYVPIEESDAIGESPVVARRTRKLTGDAS